MGKRKKQAQMPENTANLICRMLTHFRKDSAGFVIANEWNRLLANRCNEILKPYGKCVVIGTDQVTVENVQGV